MTSRNDDFLTVATIMQRRRQFLVHSFLYYVLDESFISDGQFNDWCRELIQLQADHPDLCADLPYHELTKNLNTDFSAEAMGIGKSDYPLPIVSAALFTLHQHKKSKTAFKNFAEKYGYGLES
ncbi:DNA ligase LigA-related protein [Paenibacillus hexagrammi]|uniref:NAD-dependent DNA ligase adenylation domain-containing protein n=1 Tax=Paenibacillus hexagrammi TaxID=2908839 RepID=A0ABY3SR89_9BACL|nr:hypothetical protein [Paenibacillus sp. YPD9-1]UJF36578.1 hypothetical protein L0M14_30790 [Paenibacillus sp. YPD9-1]